MRNLRKIQLIISSFLILGAVFIFGFYLGLKTPAESKVLGILNKDEPAQVREEVDFNTFWQAWSVAEQKYVDIEKVNRQEMVYGAISGLLKSLGDPYSVYFPPKENKAFQDEIRGAFEGVGMEIGIRKGILTVVAPLKDTPAEKAGIKAGDKILKIDEKPSAELSVEEAVGLIRGPRDSKVKLTIIRNGDDESRVIEVTRGVINIPIIDTATKETAAKKDIKNINIPQDIFVLKLYNFSENSAQYFRNALREMVISGKTKLVLDLRNNPGGFLEASVDIASWFLPQGEVVVKENMGRGGERIHRSKGYNIFKDLPMVILINQGSASASEILAGALRDHGKAKLVGEKSFGKGSVQELVPLTSNTSIKITIAKWLTPNGNAISEVGLLPDVEVKPTKADEEAERDVVLEKAINMLK